MRDLKRQELCYMGRILKIQEYIFLICLLIKLESFITIVLGNDSY